ncbi:hypothetical protein ABZ642_29120 [Streptomyces sp. NPDC007157]
MPAPEADQMRTRRPATHLTVVPHAAHDVHLDAPAELYETITAFMTSTWG